MEKPLLPFAIATSPEPGITLLTSPLYHCGTYETINQLQDFLDPFTATTPFRCDLLNKLRDSFRERAKQIGNGRATHPLWDTTTGKWGPLGFMAVFARMNKCAERIGLIKISDGYRVPLDAPYQEPML